MEKINLFAALAPVARVRQNVPLFKFPGGATVVCEIREQVGNLTGIWDIWPKQQVHAIEGDYLSHKDKHGYFDIFNKFEDTFLAKFAQHGPWDDWEVVKRGMKYNPDHVSTKELFHYGKLVQQGNFVEWTECDTFSHAVKNLWESTFGSGEKIIPLDNITKMPVGLFRAEDDYPGSDKDIDWLTT